MAVTLARPVTATGVSRWVVLPSPSSPLPLYPHATSVPSLFSARQCWAPSAMAVTLARPVTATGVSLWVVVPSPSWP